MDSMTLDSLSNVISKKLNVSVDSITNDEIDGLFGQYKWTFDIQYDWCVELSDGGSGYAVI